jgi:predicted ArsR family transcriptional regulator
MDALEAVGDPGLRATMLWACAQEGPVAADQLARAHELHRNVARSRLERLTAAGLLHAHFERRTARRGPGAGRPAKLYAVAPRVRTLEFPNRRYEGLIGLLLEALPRKASARSVGGAFGLQLAQAAGLGPARGLRSGFERVCEALRSLGYHATLAELGQRQAVISTAACPLRPLVHGNLDAAELDRGMWSGLLNVALPGLKTDVTCTECADGNASCRVLIAFRT